MITEQDLANIKEITRLHDEAFWHLHQYDGHAKSSDGAISIEIGFGNVWERNESPVTPRVGVAIYSYVVASDTPSYPNFGQRNHYFETVEEALQVMKEWHAEAMSYQPTAEDLEEADAFAAEMWDIIKDKVTIIDATPEDSGNLPKRFKDISNGE
jgi:hypothetical protein